METRKERIYAHVKSMTRECLNRGQFDQSIDALGVALDLGLDRANVSKELNALWTEGKLIKVGVKPVLYFDRDPLISLAPDGFIPHLIPKGQSLSDYFKKTPAELTNDSTYAIDDIIGSDGSLKEQILKAKAAVAYPPHGIHTLLIGNIGVGKLQFAKALYDYALGSGAKPAEAQFLHVNCQDYTANHRLFAVNLLGVAKSTHAPSKKGLLESAYGGIIYFNGVNRLSTESIELLSTLLETNTFSRLGESTVRQVEVMLLFSCPQNSDFLTHSVLAKLIPISVNIPDIDERGIYEKVELILSYFSTEAARINKTVHVHKDIIACFATVTYKENLAQLRSEIKLACSKAYLETLSGKANTMYVSFGHISNDMLAYNDKNLKFNADSMRVLSSIQDDYIRFDHDGRCDALTLLKEAPLKFDQRRTAQFVDTFTTDIVTIDDLEKYAIENLSTLQSCGPNQISALKNNIHPFVYQTVYAHIAAHGPLKPILHHFHLLYGILLHLSNLVKRAQNTSEKVNKEEASITNPSLSDEYQLANRIMTELNINTPIPNLEREKGYLAVYLGIAKQWVSQTSVSVLVIGHGSSIASAIVDYAKTLSSSTVTLDVIDFSSDMQLNDLLELANLKALQLDQGAGVLIISDMVPLTSIHDNIYQSTRVKARTITPLSLPLLLDVLELAKDPINSLDKLYLQLSKTHAEPPPSQQKTLDGFIEKLTHDFLDKSLSFLNATKAVETLKVCLDKITVELQIQTPKELSVKFLVHGVYMLERVIKKEPFSFAKLNSFMSNHHELVEVVEKNLQYANEVFGISIPTPEIAYLAEIILTFQEK